MTKNSPPALLSTMELNEQIAFYERLVKTPVQKNGASTHPLAGSSFAFKLMHRRKLIELRNEQADRKTKGSPA